MITQLNPPIPLDTPKGASLAHFVIDYGPEHHLMWVTFVNGTGECWTWPNPKIRAPKNITMDRGTESMSPALPPNGDCTAMTTTTPAANGVAANGVTPH